MGNETKEYVEYTLEQIMNPREFCFDPDVKQIVEKLDELCEKHKLKSEVPQWVAGYGAKYFLVTYFFQKAETDEENRMIYKELGAIKALADKLSLTLIVDEPSSKLAKPDYFEIRVCYTCDVDDKRGENKGPNVYVEQISMGNVSHSVNAFSESNEEDFLCIPVGDILDIRLCWDKDIRKLVEDLDDLCNKYDLDLDTFRWDTDLLRTYGKLETSVLLELKQVESTNIEQIIGEVQKIIAWAEKRQIKISAFKSQQDSWQSIKLEIEFEGEKKNFLPHVYVEKKDLVKIEDQKMEKTSESKYGEEPLWWKKVCDLQEIKIGKSDEIFKQVFAVKCEYFSPCTRSSK